MRRAALLAALLCAAAPLTTARAEGLADIFRSGNEAFFRGDFEHARQHYERLVAAGIRDPDVFVNLGLAQARSGELGRAILSFERALVLRPDDGDAAAALAQARAATGKRRADEQGEALVETRPPLAEALVRPYRENTLALLALVLDALLFGCLLVRRFSRADSVRTGLAIAASVAALSSGVTLGALLIKRGAHHDGRAAIVLREGAELREAPDPRAVTRAKAHEGGSAYVLARDSGFARIRTATGALGWIAEEEVGIIAD
jgi:tetratricopeptide (TPR) repeat protein